MIFQLHDSKFMHFFLKHNSLAKFNTKNLHTQKNYLPLQSQNTTVL